MSSPHPSHPRKRSLYAIGSTCIDHFLPLTEFPKENGKYRVVPPQHSKARDNLLRSIGGNVNNMALVYAKLAHLSEESRRRNLQGVVKLCTVLPKNDMLAKYVQKWYDGLRKDFGQHFDSSRVVWRDAGGGLCTPCTYILVVNDTRTCIHSPCEELEHLHENDVSLLKHIVRLTEEENLQEGDLWIYSDTRHAKFVNHLMQLLDKSPLRVPLVLDCEKWRGGDMILQLERVDYCFMNMEFPQKFWVEHLQQSADSYSLTESLMFMWNLRNDKKKCGFMLRTMGSLGSILVLRSPDEESGTKDSTNTYKNLEEFLESVQREPQQQAQTTHGSMIWDNDRFNLIYCTATKAKKIVDTTGAGDTFIGAFVFYLHNSSKPLDEIMRLAARCSSWCLEEYGNHFDMKELPE